MKAEMVQCCFYSYFWTDRNLDNILSALLLAANEVIPCCIGNTSKKKVTSAWNLPSESLGPCPLDAKRDYFAVMNKRIFENDHFLRLSSKPTKLRDTCPGNTLIHVLPQQLHRKHGGFNTGGGRRKTTCSPFDWLSISPLFFFCFLWKWFAYQSTLMDFQAEPEQQVHKVKQLIE